MCTCVCARAINSNKNRTSLKSIERARCRKFFLNQQSFNKYQHINKKGDRKIKTFRLSKSTYKHINISISYVYGDKEKEMYVCERVVQILIWQNAAVYDFDCREFIWVFLLLPLRFFCGMPKIIYTRCRMIWFPVLRSHTHKLKQYIDWFSQVQCERHSIFTSTNPIRFSFLF